MTRTTTIALAALITLATALPAAAQTQPAQPADPPAAAESVQSGKIPPKQKKKMGHAGKKKPRYGKRVPKGIDAEIQQPGGGSPGGAEAVQPR